MSSWQCKKRYGDSFSSHGTLCAGSPPDTSILHGDGCQGNSGGGLLCQEETDGRWVLTGVVAGGYGCSDPSSPALYTRVSRFRSWIDEVTAAPAEEPHARAQTQQVDNDITHVHRKLKRTHEQQLTNEINEIKHTSVST
uniref:Peptidase S1 domain-containing protein n=1 Tax=Amphiprion percula TaxID=161767 RepID=A0A3P8UB08_AMPPE